MNNNFDENFLEYTQKEKDLKYTNNKLNIENMYKQLDLDEIEKLNLCKNELKNYKKCLSLNSNVNCEIFICEKIRNILTECMCRNGKYLK